jgi:hypothetical protein
MVRDAKRGLTTYTSVMEENGGILETMLKGGENQDWLEEVAITLK